MERARVRAAENSVRRVREIEVAFSAEFNSALADFLGRVGRSRWLAYKMSDRQTWDLVKAESYSDGPGWSSGGALVRIDRRSGEVSGGAVHRPGFWKLETHRVDGRGGVDVRTLEAIAIDTMADILVAWER